MKLHLPLLAMVCMAVTSEGGLRAQTPDPMPPQANAPQGRPPLTPFPEEQDWARPCLMLDRHRVDNRLKCIGTPGRAFLTFGLEDRIEYEYLNNDRFGIGPQDDNGYLLHNVTPNADLRIGPAVRIYTAFKFDDVGGKSTGPRPGVDKDRADLHELFVQAGRSNVSSPEGFSARVGRQEMTFGTGRLIDDNYGVNVRLSFEGARLTLKQGRFRSDLFAVRPVISKPGSFDDVADHATSFWGLYTSAPVHVLPGNQVDFYYLGLDKKQSVFQDGAGREIRHSAGTRWANRAAGEPLRAGWQYNWEFTYQWGAFGPNSIHAWSISTETDYVLGKPQWKARFMLRADAASGDQQIGDRRLGTFNPLFTRGAYFGPKLVLAGPLNYYDLHPVVQLHPRQNVTASLEWVWFWRESVSDGLYSPNAMLLRPATSPAGRYIGTQPDLEVRWVPQEHFTVAFNVAGFFPGTVLNQPPKASTVAFTNLGLTYRY